MGSNLASDYRELQNPPSLLFISSENLFTLNQYIAAAKGLADSEEEEFDPELGWNAIAILFNLTLFADTVSRGRIYSQLQFQTKHLILYFPFPFPVFDQPAYRISCVFL